MQVVALNLSVQAHESYMLVHAEAYARDASWVALYHTPFYVRILLKILSIRATDSKISPDAIALASRLNLE